MKNFIVLFAFTILAGCAGRTTVEKIVKEEVVVEGDAIREVECFDGDIVGDRSECPDLPAPSEGEGEGEGEVQPPPDCSNGPIVQVWTLGRGFAPHIAFNDDGFVVAAQHSGDDAIVYSLDYAGNPRLVPYVIPDTTYVGDLVSDGDGFILTQPNSRGFVRLDADGSAISQATTTRIDSLTGNRFAVGGQSLGIGHIEGQQALVDTELNIGSDETALWHELWPRSVLADGSIVSYQERTGYQDPYQVNRSLGLAYLDDPSPQIVVIDSVVESETVSYDFYFARTLSMDADRQATLSFTHEYGDVSTVLNGDVTLTYVVDRQIAGTLDLTDADNGRRTDDMAWTGSELLFVSRDLYAGAIELSRLSEDGQPTNRLEIRPFTSPGARIELHEGSVFLTWWISPMGTYAFDDLETLVAKVDCY